jgi:hypothetical protein
MPTQALLFLSFLCFLLRASISARKVGWLGNKGNVWFEGATEHLYPEFFFPSFFYTCSNGNF